MYSIFHIVLFLYFRQYTPRRKRLQFSIQRTVAICLAALQVVPGWDAVIEQQERGPDYFHLPSTTPAAVTMHPPSDE